MTLAPRSLKLPVGANHSSLNSAAEAAPAALDQRRAAFAHAHWLGDRDGQRLPIAPERAHARLDAVAADAGQRA